jgi:hypothetical protein
MSKEKEPEVLSTEEDLPMSQFISLTISKMFENDNPIAKLEATLHGTTLDKPPVVEFEIKLLSINGKAQEVGE